MATWVAATTCNLNSRLPLPAREAQPKLEPVGFALVRTALALVVLVVALVAAGCGGSPGVSNGDDLAAGKALFVNGPETIGAPATCAACHTLSEANAVGTIGPDLDSAFGPARAQGFDVNTFEQVVREQMEIPGTPTDVALNDVDGISRIAMPTRDDYGFSDQEANNIAFFVATCSGLAFLGDSDEDPEAEAARALCAAVADPPPRADPESPPDEG